MLDRGPRCTGSESPDFSLDTVVLAAHYFLQNFNPLHVRSNHLKHLKASYQSQTFAGFAIIQFVIQYNSTDPNAGYPDRLCPSGKFV
jgi:hypothetical protein